MAWVASLSTPARDCECLLDSQNGTDPRFKLRDAVVSRLVAPRVALSYVPGMRRSTLGSHLVQAAEQWARHRGGKESASDTPLDTDFTTKASPRGFEPLLPA